MIDVYKKLSVRMAALLLLGAIAAFAAPAAAADQPAAPPPPPAAATIGAEAMQGLTWDGLTEDQKKLAVSILNDGRCDCSCGMTLATCRRDDPKCGRSLGLATQVVAMAKAGKSRDEIVKTALAPPPSKFVQFALLPGDAPSVGPADATVTILEYYDYQCPFCARASTSLDEVLKTYPNDVRLVYKMHPLPMHQQAGIAAQGVLAAHRQGKFKEMHKKLFENSSSLSRDKVVDLAKQIGVDIDRFMKDLDSPEIKAQIDKEAKEATDIGANGTPAMFVNGRYVSGAKPASFFNDMINEELKWAKEKNRPTFTVGKNVSEASPPKAESAAPDPNKVVNLPVGNAPIVGPATAKVTILHYYDYQCPFCSRIGPTLDQLLKEYPSDVRIVYKQHPLPMHSQAMISAEAAMAAQAQGKFPEMHAKLMENQRQLSRDKIFEIAKGIGLDMDRFTKEVDGHAHQAEIDAMTKEAMTAGATGTPASFVNGRFLNGAQPYESFKKLVDEALGRPAGAAATAQAPAAPSAP